MNYFTLRTSMNLITNLQLIASLAKEREEENYHFRSFLKRNDDKKTDKTVHRFNEEISAKIDCTRCGNCCRSLMINLEKSDSQRLSEHLNISEDDFEKNYTETSEEGTTIFNTIPCHFLSDNKCTVYEARPATCSEFPHLHKPGFVFRLFSVIDNYGRCPIVFNVVEELKKSLKFKV